MGGDWQREDSCRMSEAKWVDPRSCSYCREGKYLWEDYLSFLGDEKTCWEVSMGQAGGRFSQRTSRSVVFFHKCGYPTTEFQSWFPHKNPGIAGPPQRLLVWFLIIRMRINRARVSFHTSCTFCSRKVVLGSFVLLLHSSKALRAFGSITRNLFLSLLLIVSWILASPLGWNLFG